MVNERPRLRAYVTQHSIQMNGHIPRYLKFAGTVLTKIMYHISRHQANKFRTIFESFVKIMGVIRFVVSTDFTLSCKKMKSKLGLHPFVWKETNYSNISITGMKLRSVFILEKLKSSV